MRRPSINGRSSRFLAAVVLAALLASLLPLPPPLAAHTADAPPYTLAVTTDGDGNVEARPAAPGYAAGTVVTLTAKPGAALLTGWTVDGQFVGWAPTISLVMDADRTVAATFAAWPAFTDLPTGSTSAEGVSQLAARGVIKGYSTDECVARAVAPPCFGPADPLLRAQMAALLTRALGWDTTAPAGPPPFNDLGVVDAELQRAIAILAGKGIIDGYGNRQFGPTDKVLHIQVISFVARALVQAGYWQEVAQDDPTIYPNVTLASGHRLDLLTYLRYAGAIAERPQQQAWTDWDGPASRGWTAGTLWQALDRTFGVVKPPPTTNPASPTTTTITASPTTLVADGQATLALVVQLKDQFGTNIAVGGATVTLGTTRGTVSAVTDRGDGTYTATLTAPTLAGPATISGTVNGIGIAATVVVNFTPAPASPAMSTITASPATLIADGLATATITVRLYDQFGNNVVTGGATVVLSTTSGTLSAVTDTGGGTYSATLTAPTSVGTATISGTVNGNTITATATVSFTAGAATKIVKSTGDNQTGTVNTAVATAPAVLITDANNNPVAGVTVTFAVATGGGNVTGDTQTTDANGIATVGSWTLGTVTATNTLTASVSGLTSVTFTATATAGAAAKLAITTQPSASTYNGQALPQQPAIQLQDQYGNAVSQANIDVIAALDPDSGNLRGTRVVKTDGAGVATFTNLAITGAAGNYILAFTATGLTGATSDTITILGATVAPNPDTIASATIGTPIARSYTITNPNANPNAAFNGRAVGTGLGSAEIARPTIANGATQTYDFTVLPGSTSLSATIGNTAEASADLDLVVYNCTTGICIVAGQSADNDSEESVQIVNPAAGTWRVQVDGYMVPSGTTAYDYISVFFNASFGSIAVTDANVQRAAASTWTVPGVITALSAPASGRVLYGNVEVRTTDNIVIGRSAVIIQSTTP